MLRCQGVCLLDTFKTSTQQHGPLRNADLTAVCLPVHASTTEHIFLHASLLTGMQKRHASAVRHRIILHRPDTLV